MKLVKLFQYKFKRTFMRQGWKVRLWRDSPVMNLWRSGRSDDATEAAIRAEFPAVMRE